MSRSVDLFIDANTSIDELAAKLGDLAGVPLREAADVGASGSRRWTLEDGDVRAVLSEHPYVDDGDLLLSHYRFALSARVQESVRLQDSRETALLRRIADKLIHGTRARVLLVLDLQYRDRPGAQGATETQPPEPAPAESERPSEALSQ